MKTLQEIKDEVAKDNGFVSWDNLTFIYAGFIKIVQPFNDEATKRYALEVAKEALKNAAENAEAEYLCYKAHTVYDDKDNPITVNKESILNNIPDI